MGQNDGIFILSLLSIGCVSMEVGKKCGPQATYIRCWIPPQTKQKATNHHVGGEAKLRYMEESQILVWPELTT